MEVDLECFGLTVDKPTSDIFFNKQLIVGLGKREATNTKYINRA